MQVITTYLTRSWQGRYQGHWQSHCQDYHTEICTIRQNPWLYLIPCKFSFHVCLRFIVLFLFSYRHLVPTHISPRYEFNWWHKPTLLKSFWKDIKGALFNEATDVYICLPNVQYLAVFASTFFHMIYSQTCL